MTYREEKWRAGQATRAGEVTTLLERHVTPILANVPIADLTPAQLRSWVGGLRNQRKEHAGTVRLTQWRVDGLRGVMKAALRFADANPVLLRKGLGADTTSAATGNPREAPVARKMILERQQITALLDACDDDLRLFCRVLDTTGARPSQVIRLTRDDLDLAGRRIMIPRSAKGRPGSRKTDAIPFPAPDSLLDALARNATTDGLLLHRPARICIAPGVWRIVGRCAWTKNAWVRPFRAAVKSANLPAATTIYALRHSRIATMLLGGVAAQAIAKQLDTSEPMLRVHYARWIGHHDPVQAQIRALQAEEQAQQTTLPKAMPADRAYEDIAAALLPAIRMKLSMERGLLGANPTPAELLALISQTREAITQAPTPDASSVLSLLKPSRRQQRRMMAQELDRVPPGAFPSPPDRRTR